MYCKRCKGLIVEIDRGEHNNKSLIAKEILIAHTCGYHKRCFELVHSDSFKRYLIFKKAERENENRD